MKKIKPMYQMLALASAAVIMLASCGGGSDSPSNSEDKKASNPVTQVPTTKPKPNTTPKPNTNPKPNTTPKPGTTPKPSATPKPTVTPTPRPPKEGEELVKFKISNAGLLNKNNQYSLITNKSSSPLNLDRSLNYEMPVKKEDLEIVGITDEDGTPFMLAWKHPNKKTIEVSISSTAIVFFLKRPQFAGIKFNDTQKVESKIKNHADFPKLVKALETEYKNDSPCPLQPFCSTEAMIISDAMYEKMDFSNLIVRKNN